MGRKSSNETIEQTSRDAAIYVRISLDQGMGELALDRQEKECRDRAARDGVEVSAERVYSDLSISAADARKRRPAYERLLADVRAGEVGRVYVWDLDRLTRQPGRSLIRILTNSSARAARIATSEGWGFRNVLPLRAMPSCTPPPRPYPATR